MRSIMLFFVFVFLGITSCKEQKPSYSEKQVRSLKLEEVNEKDSIIQPKTIAIKDSLVEIDLPKASNVNRNLENTNLPSNTLYNHPYSWIEDYTINNSVSKQISTPAEYNRVLLEKTSFGAWLRGLPLLPKEAKVMLFNGQEKPYQEGAHRVLDIDIGRRDLQQCADAIMRLVAEYHYSKKDYSSIHFNYTSGHTIRFSDWSKGKKPIIKGSKVSFSSTNNSNNTSYKNFKKYLTNVYCYAGTASLSKELQSKKISDIAPGDVFIWGSFPGHAVIVMDVAQHKQTGKKIFLLAQSYMPAQSIHILHNFNDESLSPWYSEDFGAELMTPEWTFDRNTLKTFGID